MIKRIYYWLHDKTSLARERGEYSSGTWQDAVRKQALDLCAAKPGDILEVGCGEGLFLKQLKNKKPEARLWGIDNSPERIQQAKQRLGAQANLYVASATDLPFADNFFDAAVCINVIFNLPSADIVRQVLAEMQRVVKPEGAVIFDFRNAANWLLWVKYKLAPLYDATVRNLPLKTYYLSDIEDMCRQQKLVIRASHSLGGMGKSMAPLILIEACKT